MSVLKLSYLIPQFFSNSSVVRYATSMDNYEPGFTKSQEFKNSIQWEILGQIWLMPSMFWTIYPFLLLCLIIIIINILKIPDYNTTLTKKLIINDWCFLSGKIISQAAKHIFSYSLVALGILITTFSLWGAV